jgi:hypothetical protein
MKSKILLIRVFLSAVISTLALVMMFQNCAPMNGMLPIDQQASESLQVDLSAKLVGQPLSGNEYVNTCGDAPDFPEDSMCAMWHSSTLEGYISIAVNEDGNTFQGTSSCFDFSGAFTPNGANYRDKKNVLITPVTFEMGALVEKTSGCLAQAKAQERTRILELGLATGFSFYDSGSVGIETPSGRLLLR